MSSTAVQYDQSQYDSSLQAYESLTEVISDVSADIKRNDSATYSVAWKTPNHDHGSEYRVVDTVPLALEDTLIIEGQSRGGRYQVVPRGKGPAVIRHRRGDGTIGWEEEALELIVMKGRFKWEADDGITVFDRIREKVPR